MKLNHTFCVCCASICLINRVIPDISPAPFSTIYYTDLTCKVCKIYQCCTIGSKKWSPSGVMSAILLSLIYSNSGLLQLSMMVSTTNQTVLKEIVENGQVVLSTLLIVSVIILVLHSTWELYCPQQSSNLILVLLIPLFYLFLLSNHVNYAKNTFDHKLLFTQA